MGYLHGETNGWHHMASGPQFGELLLHHGTRPGRRHGRLLGWFGGRLVPLLPRANVVRRLVVRLNDAAVAVLFGPGAAGALFAAHQGPQQLEGLRRHFHARSQVLPLGCLVQLALEVDGGHLIQPSLSTFCLGYNTGIVAGAQEGIMEDLHLQNLAVAELVSAALLGATVGALCGQSANTLGRRRALLTTAALFVVSPLLSALSPNYAVLLFGRTLTGIPIGVSSVLTNLYITEVSPAVCRGRLGGWAPFIGTGGILVSYLVSAALQPFSHEAWRWQIGLAAVPAAAQLLLSANLPETPRWLLSQSRKEEAKDSLRQLFRKVGRECIEDEVYKLEADLCRSNVPSVRIWGLCSGEHRAATLVGVGINVLQQVSGINVFIYFAQGILDDAGFGSYAMISAAIVSCIQLLATAALIRYIDKMGRRPLAAIGIIGMLVGLMLIVLGSLLRGFGVSVGVAAWFALSSMLIYRAAFSLSLGPLPYVMTSEFFAQEARAAGVAFCWAMNWLSNFGVSLSFKVLVKALPGPFGQALIFGMYMFFCIIALVFVYMLLPETNGVSLEAERTRNRTANSEDSSTGFARM